MEILQRGTYCSETFARLYIRLQETGRFAKGKNIPGRALLLRTAEVEKKVSDVKDSSGVGTRKIIADINISAK